MSEQGLESREGGAAPDLYDPETGEPLAKKTENGPGADLYDPETGEPLSKKTENGPGADLYDPETGEPLSKKTENGPGADLYDPETGELLSKKTENGPGADLYDPETGEPLSKKTENGPGQDLYDPETGKPLARLEDSGEELDRFDPMTGKPIGRKKTWKPFAVGAAAAIILLAVVFAAAGSVKTMFKSKKDIVADALMEIVKADGFMEETFGLRELRTLVKSGTVKAGGKLIVEDASGLGIPELAGGGASMDFSRDSTHHKALLAVNLWYEDMDLLGLDFYVDDKQLMCAAPELVDQVFTLNYADNLEAQIEDSPLFREGFKMEKDGAEAVSALLSNTGGMFTGQKSYFNIAEITERYKETTKAAEKFKDAMEIEKRESKKFTVNGKTRSCKGYDVVIPKKALAELVGAAGKFLAEDEQIQNQELAYLADLAIVSYMMDGHSREDAEDYADEFQDQLMDALKDGADSLENLIKDYLDDIELTLYVDKRGRAVYLEANTSIDAYIQIDVEAEMTFKGGDTPLQNMDGVIRLSGGGDTVKLSVEQTGSEKDNKYLSESTAKFSTDYSTIQSTVSGEYNKKNGDFTVDVKEKMGSYEAKMILEGTVSGLKKGKSVTVDIDKLKFKDSSTEEIELSGRLYVEPLTGSLTPPEGETFDVLAADQDEWTEIVRDIGDEMKNIIDMLSP